MPTLPPEHPEHSEHLLSAYRCGLLMNFLQIVTFKLNVLLSLSGVAVTKTFCALFVELLLQVFGESMRLVTIWMIHGCEGVGDIPGI